MPERKNAFGIIGVILAAILGAESLSYLNSWMEKSCHCCDLNTLVFSVPRHVTSPAQPTVRGSMRPRAD